MTNKEIIESKIKEINIENNINLVLESYDEKLDFVSKIGISNILNIIGEYGDVIVFIKRKKYIAEVTCCDNEVGISVIDLDEYISNYGDAILFR